MPTHTLVRFFTGGQDPIESLLRVRQLHLIGTPISWNFRVISRAPQDVVIGLDLILRFNLHFDPSKCRLFRLPPVQRRSITVPKHPQPEQIGDRRDMCIPVHPIHNGMPQIFGTSRIDTQEANSGIHPTRHILAQRHGIRRGRKRRYKEFIKNSRSTCVTSSIITLRFLHPPDSEPPQRQVKHLIITKPDVVPVRRAAYPLSGTKLTAMHEQVTELVQKGWIQPSTSPWAAPILFVAKDGGTKLRLCIDFRDLNALTKKDAFPLPRLDLALHKAARASIFSKIDLASGFHQIEVHPPHRELTAFILPEAVQGMRIMGMESDAIRARKRSRQPFNALCPSRSRTAPASQSVISTTS